LETPTLWMLERARPAALVAAAARLAGAEPGDLDAVRRGLEALSGLPGWPGRLARYLLARPEALRKAVLLASSNGGPDPRLVEEILGGSRRRA
jgi:hypothetical protein